MADAYFKIYSLGLVFQFGYNIVAAILRGIGDSKATLYFLLIASTINIALGILFVHRFRMGVMGGAIAHGHCLNCFLRGCFCLHDKKYPPVPVETQCLSF